MNKSESKYFNTALLMDEALIRLLEVKDYEYITVKEICEKAGVNRSTFYLHYETVNDLLSECLENIKKRFFDSFANKPNDFIGSIGTVPLDDLVLISSDYLRPYLTFFKENQSLFRAVYKNPSCMQTEAQYSGISDFVAQTDPNFLKQLLGVNGLALWRYANGTDTSRVMHKDFVSPVKSVGHGITCIADLETEEEVWKVILSLCQDIGHRLRLHELSAYGVQIAVRSNDLFGSQYQCKIPYKTQLPSEIAATAFRLFRENYQWNKNVRAIAVRAINLVPQ